MIMLVFVACGFTACHENHFTPNKDLAADFFDGLKTPALTIEKWRVEEEIGRMAKADRDTMASDYRVREHYLGGGGLLWTNRQGVTSQVDTLLKYINRVDEIGFSKSRFRTAQIEKDLNTMRTLVFDDGENINKVMARLDYNATKAYVNYVVGQRYGFVNPHKVFNKLELDERDSLHKVYHQLFDVDMQTAGAQRYKRIFLSIANDSVPHLLRTAEPQGALYECLKAMLPTVSGTERNRVFANMERCRWRRAMNETDYKKYVVVNIPSYQLLAVDDDKLLEMKIVCGSRKTKTPLLSSHISLMELNPKWLVPNSIIKHEMSNRAGDVDYFERNNYYITDRNTGKRLSPENVTAEMLRNGSCKVVQEGGEGNSLGRIIFRFPNDFSIYLHDTSSPSAFARADRSLSHGCMRVEKPFELAQFLLADKDETVLDKIKYSMTVRTKMPAEGEEDMPEYKVDKKRILHSLKVEPKVPVFVTYQTLYLMPDGTMRKYPDVYGYDQVIVQRLGNYIN